MNKVAIQFLVFILLSACTDESNSHEEKVTSKPKKESWENEVRRHIEAKLSIPATEKYSYHVYKENLDGDGKEDAIITLNRLEFALEEASKSDNTAKRAEIGFMGNYNYIFYYDGALDQISPQIAIPSSPNAELKVSFENISSDAYKDILVDFRVLNAEFKDFYTVSNHLPRRIFQWKNFDGLNKPEKEAYFFTYEKGTISNAKDILVMKANLKNSDGIKNIYSYQPEIEKTNELIYRFFYHPSVGKYVSKKE